MPSIIECFSLKPDLPFAPHRPLQQLPVDQKPPHTPSPPRLLLLRLPPSPLRRPLLPKLLLPLPPAKALLLRLLHRPRARLRSWLVSAPESDDIREEKLMLLYTVISQASPPLPRLLNPKHLVLVSALRLPLLRHPRLPSPRLLTGLTRRVSHLSLLLLKHLHQLPLLLLRGHLRMLRGHLRLLREHQYHLCLLRRPQCLLSTGTHRWLR